ncbi:hypothetical protein OJ253_2720 [Cryptosporidium canis]|uniref:Dynein light intermediate chain n=1 Tax=Cryptosporidium canis TaxID=195482 RepID=A0A9D5HUY2_9CRYT|nr:hypothetical protein OJ253_2720 [Cryptosporidium canis]
MRKQSSMLPMPRGSRGDSFSMPNSASSAFSKFGSKYIGGGVGKQDGQGLWQDILRSFMNGLEDRSSENLQGTLFVLGRAGGGKSELIAELKKIAEKSKDRDVGTELDASSLPRNPYIGLDFCSIKIGQALLRPELDDSIDDSNQTELDKETETAPKRMTLDVWSVDHCGMSDELVRRLVEVFNSQSGVGASENFSPNASPAEVGSTVSGGGLLEEESVSSVQSPSVMFLIVLDSSLPWTLNDDLATWVQQIQECWSRALEASSSSPDIQRVMIQDLSHYFESRADGAGPGPSAGGKNASDAPEANDEELTPEMDDSGDSEPGSAPAQYPKVNLGIPIGVVLAKSDIGQRFSIPTDGATGQPLIPFALSFLMSFGEPYGMSYFVTSILTSGDIHQSSGVDLLLRYILHRLFDTPLADEDGNVIQATNNVIYRNNSICSVFPRTPIGRLGLTPPPDVKSGIYEELVPKSKFSSGAADSNDASELVHGLSTAFDKKIPSLNDFLEQIRPQIPLIEPASPGAAPVLSQPPGLTASASYEEAKSTGDSAPTKGAAPSTSGSTSGAGASQRLKPSKSSLNPNNPTASGDPSLKGFFQSLIQRGEKKGSISHRSNLKPAPSMNLRKEFGSRADSKIEEKTPDPEANTTPPADADTPASLQETTENPPPEATTEATLENASTEPHQEDSDKKAETAAISEAEAEAETEPKE